MNTTVSPSEQEPGEPTGDDLRAAEYVLGVLDAAERREVQQRMTDDASLARRVEEWEQRFAPWLSRVEAVEPSALVWPRITQRLGWRAAAAKPALRDNAVFWRRVAALASAAALAAIAFGLTRPQPAVTTIASEEQAARPVTVLVRDNGAAAWIARVDAARGKVLMVPVPSPLDGSGRVNELWIIPVGGAPHSLGFLSNDKAHTIDVPAGLRNAVAAGAIFAVTLEDQSGIPHAAPSSPIVAKGSILSI